MIRRLSGAVPRRRRVLLRADLNVPIVHGRVKDDFRIRAVLPSIRRLLRAGNQIVLLSHHSDRRQTLRSVARHLGSLLGEPVAFVRDPARGGRARARVILLENLRFWRGEEAGEKHFAETLAFWGDAYVNDAFGVSHRSGASITILPKLVPAYLGVRFEEELSLLDRLLRRPRRPLIAIFGGAKIETKLPILQRFSRIADQVLVGGGLANTILRARGFSVGSSLAGKDGSGMARLARSPNVILPQDAIVSSRGRDRILPLSQIGPHDRILDIGPASRRTFGRIINAGRTVIWNGPLGLVEERRYAAGTLAIAKVLMRHKGFVLVGGGDTVAFLDRVGLAKRFKHVSTGGGAMMAYLAGEKLPGLEALRQ
ncbi:MAG: phosphoglycerate kinase [Candidatus Sungbacteria bacterium]|uniref:Phosphoglycerate kinase n=1 Tax=Candidatus Sungiibacteriota bacterium TaxID=2750080 RepID=A0A932YW51_9BACT|nr:phosphoglycerate kinase [Candidatus Sungbacteria bacterium]